jgi:secondary thiamine-phosphate synthase enzyme
MKWFHRRIELPAMRRGFHLVTDRVVEQLPEIGLIRVGLLHLFLQHTSASLTLSENADPDVPIDLESSFHRLVPESWPYRHDIEGRDDMPAHVKNCLLGASLSIPVVEGCAALGTWQGIYLCEHRDHGGPRRVMAILYGEARTQERG